MMLAAALLLLPGDVPSSNDFRGDWINERNSAVVRIDDCPTGLCGRIIWSSSAAQADAKAGGTSELTGTAVMFDFALAPNGQWRGRLFVPDLNRTVRAAIELQTDGRLLLKGCQLGGLACKSQRWTRWMK